MISGFYLLYLRVPQLTRPSLCYKPLDRLRLSPWRSPPWVPGPSGPQAKLIPSESRSAVNAPKSFATSPLSIYLIYLRPSVDRPRGVLLWTVLVGVLS